MFLTNISFSGQPARNESIPARRLERTTESGLVISPVPLRAISRMKVVEKGPALLLEGNESSRRTIQTTRSMPHRYSLNSLPFIIPVADPVIQKPKKRLKRSIKLEEEDYKPVIKQEKNYDFPVKKEEEKDVKLNIKDEKNGLTPDTKKAILANIPPYQMPEHLTRQFLDETIPRVMLTWAFGAHPQFMFIDLTFLDRSIVRGAMAATYAFNPDAPRAPGQHGIHLRPHETGARLNPFPVFICNEKARWNYRGHYIGDRSAPMPAAIYNQQSELVSGHVSRISTWPDFMPRNSLRKPGWTLYMEDTASSARRLFLS